MSYCTIQDVEAYYLNKSFQCGDWIEPSEVESFIAQDAVLINAKIKKKVNLPITDDNDLLLLKIINEKMVVGTLDGILREKGKDQKFDRQRNCRKEAQELLDMIVKGDIELDGTEKTSVIKFNNVDSEGNTVGKRWKEADIEPTHDIIDRERRTISRIT